MNPAEREELARLLPSPGDPVLPGDRLTALEGHLMREITRDPAARRSEEAAPRPLDAAPQPSAESAPYTLDDVRLSASRPSRPPRPRRRFALVAMPVGVAVAVLATVLGVRAIGDDLVVDKEAAGLLNRIAGVAAAGESPRVRDDQYIYTRTQGMAEGPENKKYPFQRSDWLAVDGKRAGLARTTWLAGRYFPEGMRDEDIKAFLKEPTEEMRLYGDPSGTTYRDLQALPTDPDKLYEKVWADTSGQGQTHEEAALEHIDSMLDTAQLLPELNGALCRAAARIPGVTVVEHAKDAAGREGIGLAFGDGDDRNVWVFDRKTLKYLGSQNTALLAVGVADKVGEPPRK